MRLAIAILLASVCSSAQPPQTTRPTSPGDAKNQNASPEQSQKQSKNTVESRPGKGTIQSNAKQNSSQESNPDTEQNRRIADYTFQLARYTKALVTVGVIQALIFIGHFWIFRRTLITAQNAAQEQSTLTRRSNAITRRAVREAERANAANEALTRINAEAASASAKVARDVFVSANRPKLAVRFMQVPEGITSDTPEAGISITGTFLVFNTGETPAVITQTHSEVVIAEHLPPRAYKGKIGVEVDRMELSSGQYATLNFPSDGPMSLNDFKPWGDIDNRKSVAQKLGRNPTGVGLAELYVIGWVEYFDPATRVRRMGFCRKYDFVAKRFVLELDQDYEYDD